MKKISKLLSILLCLAMILSMVTIASAASSGTITFDDVAKRTEVSTQKQVWVENGITVTNEKAESASDVNEKYSNPIRLYKGSSVTVAFTGIQTVVFTCNNESYATQLVASLTSSEYTVAQEGKVVTVTMKAAANSLTFSCAAQIRLDSVSVNETPAAPEVPENNDPAADSTLSIKDALALGATKESNAYTSGKYYVVGEIVEVYQTTYGNMKIKDAEGNILTVYGTYSADGSTRYDALETKPVAGDTVKVYGIIGQYNGTPQMKNGWIVEHTAGAGTPSTPVDPPAPVLPEYAEGTYTKVTDINEILAGGKFVIVAYGYTDKLPYAMTTLFASNNKLGAMEVTVADSTVSGKLPVWTIAAKNEGVSINYDGAYIQYTTGTNVASAEAAYQWNVVASADGTFRLVASSNDTRALLFRQDKGNSMFGAYALANETNGYGAGYTFDLHFYKLNDGTSAPENPGTPDVPVTPEKPEPPKTGDTLSVAIAMLMMGAMGTVALITKKD